LVMGASTNPSRYSNRAVRRLVENGFETMALGLRSGSIAGVPIETELSAIDAVETVTLYLNPTRQQQYYDALINLNPKRVIFNPGTENPEFYDLLKANDIEPEVACTLVLLGTGQYAMSNQG